MGMTKLSLSKAIQVRILLLTLSIATANVVHYTAVGVAAFNFIIVYLKVITATVVAVHYALQVARVFRLDRASVRIRVLALSAMVVVVATAALLLSLAHATHATMLPQGSSISCRDPTWTIQAGLEFLLSWSCVAGAFLLTRRLSGATSLPTRFELRHLWILTTVFAFSASVGFAYEISELLTIRSEQDCESYLASPMWAVLNILIRVIVVPFPVVTTALVFGSAARGLSSRQVGATAGFAVQEPLLPAERPPGLVSPFSSSDWGSTRSGTGGGPSPPRVLNPAALYTPSPSSSGSYVGYAPRSNPLMAYVGGSDGSPGNSAANPASGSRPSSRPGSAALLPRALNPTVSSPTSRALFES